MARPKLSERLKADIGLIPQTISNSNATGDYYDMRGWRKAMAVCVDGANAINKVTQVEFLQATAKAGTGAKVVKQGNAAAGTESKAVGVAAATATSKVTEAVITFGTVLNTTTISITGSDGVVYVFTAHTNTTTAANREFKIDGNDAADCTAFCGLVNHATYGVPGVTAVDGGAGACTLVSTESGEHFITVSTSAIATAVITVTKQILYCECDIGDLDLDGGFFWLAVKVTKAGNGIVGAVLLRESNDYPRDQIVAAGTVL